MEFETKFTRLHDGIAGVDGAHLEGYASLFDAPDQGGDVVKPGAFDRSLDEITSGRRALKMLWQHDPAQPIGVWDEVRIDDRGLYVKGRLLDGIAKAREAQALVSAGAIDGLSIGYRTVKATKARGDAQAGQRYLTDLDLWEVSLVTFPMLSSARVASKAADADDETLCELARFLEDARLQLAGH